MCTKQELRKLYARRNTLKRYKVIADYYQEVMHPDIPFTRIWKNYIYPKFFISKSTLYKVVYTPIDRELREVERRIEECHSGA